MKLQGDNSLKEILELLPLFKELKHQLEDNLSNEDKSELKVSEAKSGLLKPQGQLRSEEMMCQDQ